MAIEPGQLLPGEPELLVPATRTWHVRDVTWSPDSRTLLCNRDEDYGDTYELVPRVEND